MNNISSLDEFIDELNEVDKQDVPKVLERLRLTKEELDDYASWNKCDYTRNCIIRTDSYELILLCWDAASSTPIHDHGGQDCWVYQAEGQLTELRYSQKEDGTLVQTKELNLQPHALTYMHDNMGYHQLCNKEAKRGYTLHIYASPIDECDVFNEDKNCFETKEMSYDTHEGVVV